MQNKSELFKPTLRHKEIRPLRTVSAEKNENSFQNTKIIPVSDIVFPIVLTKDEIILDFGDHYTGYLHLNLDTAYGSAPARRGSMLANLSGSSSIHIPDSPVNIVFSFAEMPIELTDTSEDSPNALSVGWLQNDYKTVPFMPYSGSLERRYSFRYLKLKRIDSVRFPVGITDIYIDAVSAVDEEESIKAEIKDPILERIDKMCVKTLKECEQDVFEDGPKRDRRLWIGDLRLQALTDYRTFRNVPLIKRCIYLFAEHLNEKGLVAPCVFPDTPPYVDGWIFADYSLCLILCLYDYLENTGDTSLPEELFPVCEAQINYVDSVFDRTAHKINENFFIDHPKFSRTVSSLGYFAYTLQKAVALAEKLNKPTEKYLSLYGEVKKAILHYRRKSGLFADNSDEISQQSQIWVALSGVLSKEETANLLKLAESDAVKIKLATPFAVHYQIEALISCGEKNKALEIIRSYWGAMADAGFDCCPECFNPNDELYTPYRYPVLNSACHAWSCTPSYWIRKYFTD